MTWQGACFFVGISALFLGMLAVGLLVEALRAEDEEQQ